MLSVTLDKPHGGARFELWLPLEDLSTEVTTVGVQTRWLSFVHGYAHIAIRSFSPIAQGCLRES